LSSNNHTFAILAYGQSPYLQACIESLKAQTVQSNIVICTSTPSIFLDKIAAQYQLNVLVNTNRKNQSNDMNFAMAQCQSTWLTLAHQDDLYLPTYTATFLAQAQKSDAIVFCDYKELHQGQEKQRLYIKIKHVLLWPFQFKKALTTVFWKKSILWLGNPICHPTVLHNMQLLKAFAYNEAMINADIEAWERLAKQAGGFRYIGQALVLHRLHQASATSQSIGNKVRYQEELAYFERTWGRPLGWCIAQVYRWAQRYN
jgi:glycosyltransferase involved in cell wall biosynthesis